MLTIGGGTCRRDEGEIRLAAEPHYNIGHFEPYPASLSKIHPLRMDFGKSL
ncbi:MAG: hypothetical protein ACLFU6_06370 [Candidatus Hydrogenedentota bacterium]